MPGERDEEIGLNTNLCNAPNRTGVFTDLAPGAPTPEDFFSTKQLPRKYLPTGDCNELGPGYQHTFVEQVGHFRPRFIFFEALLAGVKRRNNNDR